MHRAKKLISFLLSVILFAVFALSVFAGSGQSPFDYIRPGSLMSIDQKDGTVQKFKQNITGKITSKDRAEKVTYEVYAAADKGEMTASGEAVPADGTFTFSDLRLKPDNNRIEVTVQSGGKTETQTININYNAGSIKDVPMKDVTKVSGSEMKYVTNNLLVFFDEGTDDTRRQAIIDTVGGQRVGFIDGINMWQVEVKRGTYEQLRKAAEKLEALEGVFNASCNMAQAAKTMVTVPSDPWYDNKSPPWNELNPYGGNWSVEAIQAMSAWDYQYFYKLLFLLSA